MISLAKIIVENTVFKKGILIFIFVAAVIIGLETHVSFVAQYGHILHFLDQLILFIFSAELVLKILAEYPRPLKFFKDPWNVFDFLIVFICLLPIDSQFAAVLRLARVLRVLRLVTALPKLQLLVGALLKSLPSMGYVGLLLSILFYIYGVTGVFFFSKADPIHFGNLGDSILTLFGVITLEGWTSIMYELLRGSHELSSAKVIIYFVSFVLFGTMIMLNLFIGVIMNSMQEMQAESLLEKSDSKPAVRELEAIVLELESLKSRVQRAQQKI